MIILLQIYRPFPRTGEGDEFGDANISKRQWIISTSGCPIMNDSSDIEEIQKDLYSNSCIQLYLEQESGKKKEKENCYFL